MSTQKRNLPRPKKLGILMPGLGAIASTLIAGVFAIQKGISLPVGSLTQMGRIRLGKRTDKNSPKIDEFLDLVPLKDIIFGGWDIFEDNMYESAVHANVLDKSLLEQLKPELSAIKPFKAVFEPQFVKKLHGTYIKSYKSKYEAYEKLVEDIREFKTTHNLDEVVMIWTGSTEVYIAPEAIPKTLAEFEDGLKNNHPSISPCMIYAYAALKEGVPFANGSPNTALDLPAIQELAKQTRTPISGKDLKTGQTLMKTIIAPGIKARLLGVHGWFSTNILGNRDGEVLDDPESFKAKEISKLSVLDTIFQPDLYPELYKDTYHKVRINYYPPHGDNKEGWDNIDIFGWLGYRMQIKVNFLCRDSILAAPLLLDIALFMEFAKRNQLSGTQEWLSFYFKAPHTAPELSAEHDVFIQLKKLKNTLRYLKGYDPITHLGNEYYNF
jgi:myo-inositol-1-phosphate synthase